MPPTRVVSERGAAPFLRALYGPELYDYAGYRLELTLLYTWGKTSLWPKTADESTAGVVGGAFTVPQGRVAAGAALVDVEVTHPPPRMSLVSGRSRPVAEGPTLGQYRFSTLQIVAHEMFHFIQAWRGGSVLEGGVLRNPHARRYTAQYLRLVEALREKHPDWTERRVALHAHTSHPSEREAERFSRRRLESCRRSVERGDWDACLPIEDMRRFQEAAGSP